MTKVSESPEQRLGGLSTELTVAALLVHAGWNVYMPQRDVGIDFIATKKYPLDQLVIRPIQVKGCHWRGRKDTTAYGKKKMKLAEYHPEMCLALAFYYEGCSPLLPECVAFLPFSQLVCQQGGTYRCEPACIKEGKVSPRREFARYFDQDGLLLMDNSTWSSMRVREK